MNTRSLSARATEPISRKHFGICGRVTTAILAMAATMLIAGCPQYYSEQEVIPQSAGDRLPYVDAAVMYDNNTKLNLTPVTGSNDVRFDAGQANAVNCDKGSGVLRFLQIKEDIYAVQQKCDGENEWSISFYRIHPHEFQELDLAKSADNFKLADRYHVTLKMNDGGNLFLYGTQGDELAFLRAHKNFKFKPTDSDKDKK